MKMDWVGYCLPSVIGLAILVWGGVNRRAIVHKTVSALDAAQKSTLPEQLHGTEDPERYFAELGSDYTRDHATGYKTALLLRDALQRFAIIGASTSILFGSVLNLAMGFLHEAHAKKELYAPHPLFDDLVPVATIVAAAICLASIGAALYVKPGGFVYPDPKHWKGRLATIALGVALILGVVPGLHQLFLTPS